MYATFNKIKTSCRFGRYVGGQSHAFQHGAHTNPTILLKKSNCHKISPLDGFDLKFGMQDNFDVLYKSLASIQLIVEIIHWTRDFFALKCKLPIYRIPRHHMTHFKSKRLQKNVSANK